MTMTWEQIRDEWREVKTYKWKCNNIPPEADLRLKQLIRAYKEYYPNMTMFTSACKLPATITTIGLTLKGLGLIEEKEIYNRHSIG